MKTIKMVIPKGRIFDNVARLLADSGFGLEIARNKYAPRVKDPSLEAKIMKPQNIAQLVELGAHDIGFTGYDWIIESAANVVEIMDLELDPVKIVAAVPANLAESDLTARQIIVASEYQNISRTFLRERNFDYLLIRSYGATEAFPPQDADMIIDNASSGRTLKDHGLRVVAEIMGSSTRVIANSGALEDEWKKNQIEQMRMVFTAVMNARKRVMLEMNVPLDRLREIVGILPCMRAPTVSHLYGEEGYAVKAAVRKEEIVKLIPRLKRMGATDILEYELKKVII